MNDKKGRDNRFKIGQKVRAKPYLVDWNASHLAFCYGRKPKDGGYHPEEKELHLEDLWKVYLWTRAYLTQEMPIGKVIGYGSLDGSDKPYHKNLFVKFTFETEIKSNTYDTFVAEKDLVAVRSKSRKR